jgi:hypothetical protein
MLTTSGAIVNENVARPYFASTLACGSCRLQQQCCPNTSARKILRSIYEHARELARSLPPCLNVHVRAASAPGRLLLISNGSRGRGG